MTDTLGSISIFAVDVGSVRRKGGFAWATPDARSHGQDDPSTLGDAIVGALGEGHPVVVSFESPLSIPVPASSDWSELGRARDGDGNRPWSASAGTAALATGLVQLAWLLRYVKEHTPRSLRATTQVDRFIAGDADLLISEALVSGAGKPQADDGKQDHADAVAAARRTAELLRRPPVASDARCEPHTPLNLAAVAAMHAGLEIDPEELRDDVLVAKTSAM